jgi:hypothetical protein
MQEHPCRIWSIALSTWHDLFQPLNTVPYSFLCLKPFLILLIQCYNFVQPLELLKVQERFSEMDPLSVSASIIAVLQIATSVSSFCMQYVRSAKNAKAELLRLVQELGGLQIVLTTLKQLTERGTDSSQSEGGLQSTASEDPYLLPTLRKLCGLEHVFQECLRKLKQLERDITPQLDASTSPLTKKEAIIRALRWPIKEVYMKSIMDDINEYITLFSLALTLDETYVTYALSFDLLDLVCYYLPFLPIATSLLPFFTTVWNAARMLTSRVEMPC